MARRRMSDTACIASAPTADRSEYHSKSVRAINNGFIVSETTQSDGEYRSHEYFTKNPDKPMKQQGCCGPEGLSGAISECNK